MMSTTCPLCTARKAKRACPALSRQICAVCCGTKRLTEITCPPDCSYLATSRTHPPAVAQRRQERDLRFMLPLLTEMTEPQYRLLVLFQGLTLRHAATAIPALLDADVEEAASTVAATLETARKGIIYKHRAASIPAQRLAGEYESLIAEVVREAESRRGALDRDAAAALRQLARAAATAATTLPEDEPPVFLKLLGRVMTRPDGDTEPEGAVRSAPRLVIPG